MSYEDGIIWRTHLHLALFNLKSEPCAIVKITPLRVNISEYSAKETYPDGTWKYVGAPKTLSLDRQKLDANRVYRGRVMYSLDNPDEDSAMNAEIT